MNSQYVVIGAGLAGAATVAPCAGRTRADAARTDPARNPRRQLPRVCPHLPLRVRVYGITLVSACSGHGAKFAPVIGELAAAAASGEGSVSDQFKVSAFAGSVRV